MKTKKAFSSTDYGIWAYPLRRIMALTRKSKEMYKTKLGASCYNKSQKGPLTEPSQAMSCSPASSPRPLLPPIPEAANPDGRAMDMDLRGEDVKLYLIKHRPLRCSCQVISHKTWTLK